MSQGITVSLQAKIEGWKEQLAQIQNAAKKVNLGSEFGKSLTSNMSDLEKRVNEMSRHMRQTFTSDSSIDSFVRKVGEIDEKFKSVGSSLSKINYDSLDPSYIKNNFSELYKEVEKAEKELAQGIDAAFKEGIASGTKLGNLLDKLKIDPSSINIDTIGTAITATMSDVEKAVKKGNEELAQMRTRLSELQATKNRLETVDGIKDVKSTVSNMIGTPESYGITKSLNTDAVEEFVKNVTGKLDNLGEKVQEKRAEIDTALENLGKAGTIEDAKTALSELSKAAQDAGVVREIGVSNSAVTQLTKNLEVITQDTEQFRTRMEGLREQLLSSGISEAEVNKLMPDISEDIWSRKFDGAQKAIENAIVKIQTKIQTELPKINEEIATLMGGKDVEGSINAKLSSIFTDVGTLRQMDASSGWIDKLRSNIAQSTSGLSETLKTLQDTLSSQALSGIQNIGTGISEDSARALEEAAIAAQQYKDKLDQVKAGEQMVGKIQGVVQRWFSIYAAIRMVRKAIQEVISTISELDKTITNIAIVTDMDQNDLWSQMPKYTQLAREYAASISGVYEVSQLYYQQGLSTNQVMSLTEQTLKMARISGLDYADATDYMTNAVRSFKMELTDSQRVVDVYSAVAASSATSVSELASAMSKTASSAQAVGSSFENTTAMMAVMIEATRESAENIGSALKSIISRYGEMKADPSKLIDSEGEAMSLNKVDTALQTVGISIHDAAGQFRDFDEVIVELASKWDTIDTNTQRYIATIMAGNRQQSRFLALVSSYDRLKELSAEAADSEDASQQQYLKTLDSIEAKQQQLKTSVQDIYTSSGVQDFYKGILDFANNITLTFDQLSSKMGVGMAISKIGANFTQLAVLATNSFKLIKMRFTQAEQEMVMQSNIAAAEKTAAEAKSASQRANLEAKTASQQANSMKTTTMIAGENGLIIVTEAMRNNAQRLADTQQTEAGILAANEKTTAGILAGEKARLNAYQQNAAVKNKLMGKAMIASAAGMAMTTLAANVDVNEQRGLKAGLTAGGSILSGAGMGAMIGGVPGIIVGALSALPGIIEAIGMATESAEEKLSRLTEIAKAADDERIKTNQEYKSLKSEIEELEELKEARFDSAEAAQAYIDASNKIAESTPDLVSSYDSEGNAIISLENAYEKLAAARQKASDAAVESTDAALDIAKTKVAQSQKVYGEAITTTLRNNQVTLNFEGYLGEEPSQAYNAGIVDPANILIEDAIDKVLEGFYSDSFDETKDEEYYGRLFYDALVSWDLEKIGEYGTDANFYNRISSSIEAMKNATDEQEQQLGQVLEKFFNALYGEESQSEESNKARQQVTANQQEQSAEEKNLLRDTTNKKITAQAVKNDILPNYLADFEYAQEAINNYVYSQWDGVTDIKAWLESADATVDYNTIFSSLEAFWNGLGANTSDAAKIISERSKYTQEQFESKMQDFGADKTLIQALSEYYTSAFDINQFRSAIFTRYRTNENDLWIANAQHSMTDIEQAFSPEELQNLLTKYDTLQKLISNNSIGLADGQAILDNYIDAFTAMADNEEIQTVLQGIDFTSWSSVINAIKTLSDDTKFDQGEVAKIKAALEEISHDVPLNIYTETQLLVDHFTEGISDFQTSIKNVIKGMDFKAMASEIEKNGFTVDDFTFKNGKYYAKTPQTYVEALKTEALGGESYSQLKEEQKLRYETATNDYTTTEKTAQEILHLSDSEYDKLFKDFVNNADTKTTNIIDYYFDQQSHNLDSLADEAQRYATDVAARTYLENGDIENFIDTINIPFISWFPQLKQQVIEGISSGDISNVSSWIQPYLSDYSELIYTTFSGTGESVASAMTTALSGGSKEILVTGKNLQKLTELKNKGWITGTVEAGKTVEFNVEKLKQSGQAVGEWITAEYDNVNDQLKALQAYYDSIYTDKVGSFEKIATGKEVSRNDFTTYLSDIGKEMGEFDAENELKKLAGDYGLAMDAAGNFYVSNTKKYLSALRKDFKDLKKSGASTTQLNSLRAKISTISKQAETEQYDAFENVIKNYDKITPEIRQSLADSLNINFNSKKLKNLFSDNGEYEKVDLSELKTMITDNKDLSDQAKNRLISLYGSIQDEATKVISNAASYISKGTSSAADMDELERIAKDFGIDTKDLFKWSDVTHNYKLNLKKYKLIIEKQSQKMKEDGIFATDEEAKEWANNTVLYGLEDAIDLSSFLSSDNKTKGSQAYNKLKEEIEAYKTTLGEAADDDTIDNIISTITGGGLDAVHEAQSLLKDHDFTSAEISELYYGNVQKLIDAGEELNKGVGAVISSEAAAILRKAGYQVDQLDGTSSYVISSMGDVGQAAIEYYNQIKNTNVELSEKMKAAAKSFDAKNNNATFQYASSASGMSSDQLLEMLSAGGVLNEADPESTLANFMKIGWIEALGDNNYRIDYDKFAENFGWTKDSEVYRKYRSQYIQSLISSDQELSNGIKSAISALGSIDKTGEIDSTYILKLFDNKEADLIEALEQYKMTYEDGVIKVAENSDVTGLLNYLLGFTLDGGISDAVKNVTKQQTKDNKVDVGFQKIFSDINNVSDEALAALFEGMGITDTNEIKGLVEKYTQIGANGNRQLKLSEIPDLLAKAGENASDATYQYIKGQIAQTADSIISGINTAQSALSGINTLADSQKIINQFQEFVDQHILDAIPSNLFEYSDALGTNVLSTSGYATYRQAALEYLNQLGIDVDQAATLMLKQAKSNVKISDYLSSSNKGQGSQARATLKSSMTAVLLENADLQSTNVSDYIDQARVEVNGRSEAEGLAQQYANQAALHNKIITDAAEAQADADIEILNSGDEAAIEIAKKYSDTGELTQDQVEAAYRSQVTPITSLISVLSDLEAGSIVAQDQIELLRAAGYTVSQNGVVLAVGNVVNAYNKLLSDLIGNGEATASDINAAAAKVLNAPYENAQNGVNALNKGAKMSWDDFTGMYTAAGKTFGRTLIGHTENGHEQYGVTEESIQAEKDRLIAEGAITVDALGQVSILNAELMAEILNWDTNSKEYQAALSAQHDALIEEEDKLNDFKRSASQISNLSSAKNGTIVNTDSISEPIRQILGLGEDFKTTMTSTLKAYMLQNIDDAIAQASEEEKESLYALKEQLKSEQVGRTNAVQGIISKQVDSSALKTIAKYRYGNENLYEQAAEYYKFQWDEFTQQWIATEETYERLQQTIDFTPTDTKEHREQRNNLQALLNDLQNTEEQKPTTTIKNLLDNELNISEQMLADFKTQWSNITIEDYYTIDANGQKVLKTADFVAKMREVSDDFDKKFSEAITKKVDSLVSSMNNVGKYFEGFENVTDKQNFIKTLQDFQTQGLIGAFDTESLFTTNAFGREIITTEAYQLYYNGVQAYLGKLGIGVKEATKMLLEQAQQGVDISGFLSSYAAGDITSANEKLRTELIAWATAAGEDVNNVVNTYGTILSEGGIKAVNLAKQIKGSITTEEASSLFKTEIDRYMTTIDQLQSMPGTVIDKTTAELIGLAGGEAAQLGESGSYVVTTAANLVEAYKELFRQVQKSGEATLAQLNQIQANILSAQNATETFGLDLLSKGGGISFSEIAELLAQQGQAFSENLYNMWVENGLVEGLGGDQFRILDFDMFAKLYDIPQDSIRYLQEYSKWVDTTVTQNKDKQTNIQSQLEGLAGSKAGDQLNVSYLVDMYTTTLNTTESTLAHRLASMGASLENGILTIAEGADIVGITELLTQTAVEAGQMLKSEAIAQEAAAQQNTEAKINEANNAFRDAFADLTEVSDESLTSLYTALSALGDNVLLSDGIDTYSRFIEKYTKTGANGKKQFDLSQVKSFLETYSGLIDTEVYEYLKESIMTYGDQIISSLQTYNGYISAGTTNMADMQKFVNEYANAVGQSISINDAFKFDTNLSAYTLDTSVYRQYLVAQANALSELGFNIEEVLKTMTAQLQSNIDISGFVSGDIYDSQNVQSLVRSIEAYAAATNTEISEAGMLNIINTLTEGGDKAVDTLKALKGENVSTSEISAVYNAKINRLQAAASSLAVSIGDNVSGEAIKILEAAGYGIDTLPDGSGVVKTIGDMTTAYGVLYSAMEHTGQATLTSLNEAYANIVKSATKKETDAIATLGSGMGLSLDDLSSLIQTYGRSDYSKQLKNWIDEAGNLTHYGEMSGLESIGNNKYRIKNFKSFAGFMRWDEDSEEYTAALKSYNDALITQATQISTNLADELTNIASAKAGQQVNITQIQDALGLNKFDGVFNEYLSQYGAEVKNGILTIKETANIPQIINGITQKLAEAGDLIPSQLAELQDTLADYFSTIAGYIEDGTKGELSHVDAGELQNWASTFGVNLNPQSFVETANGVKLTTDAFNELYVAVKQVNPELAKTMLSNASNLSDYKDWNSMMNTLTDTYIRTHKKVTETTETTQVGGETATQIAKPDTSGVTLLNSIDVEVSGTNKITEATTQTHLLTDATNQYGSASSQLDASDEVSKTTAAINNQKTVLSDLINLMTTDSDSFNFMSGSLPEDIQAGVNLWNNAASAMSTLKTAATNGYIGVQDYYNIITTASGLLSAAGEEFSINGKNAAQLMEDALMNIKTVNGEAVIDLSDAGLTITGVNDLKSSLTDGINDLAKAEIEILDAEIKVMEVLAAMEELGSVDINGNGIAFEVEDIYDPSTMNWSKAFSDYLAELQKTVTETDGLTEIAKSIKINGVTFYSLLSASASEWEQNAGLTKEMVSKIFATLSTTDWDLDNLQTQIPEVLSKLEIPNLSIDLDAKGEQWMTISPAGDWVKFDLSNSTTQKNVETSLDEAMKAATERGGSLHLEGETLQEKVQSAWELYNDKSAWENLSWDEQCDISIALAYAEGKLTVPKKDKTGKWTATYNGKTFTGTTEENVLNKISQAMDLEKLGYTFYLDDKGHVKGTITVGDADITVTTDPNGNKWYYPSIGGGPFKTEDEALSYMAANGYFSDDTNGKVFNTTIDGKAVTVTQYHSTQLNITYGVTSDGKFVYNGKTFQTYDQLVTYVEEVESLLKTGWNTYSGQNYEIYYKGQLQIKRNLTDGTYSYWYGDQEFKSKTDFDNYVEAMTEAEEQGAEIDSNGTFTFKSNGWMVKCVIIDGKTWFEGGFYDGDGGYHTIQASSKSDLTSILSAYAKVTGGELPADSGDKPIEFYKDGKKFIIKYNTDGSFVIEDENGNPVSDATAEAVAAELKKGAEEGSSTKVDTANVTIGTVNASAESANLTFGENTSANLPLSLLTTDAQTQLETLKNEITTTTTMPITANITSALSLVQAAINAATAERSFNLTANVNSVKTVVGKEMADIENSVVEFTVKSHEEGVTDKIKEIKDALGGIATNWTAKIIVIENGLSAVQKAIEDVANKTYSATITLTLDDQTGGESPAKGRRNLGGNNRTKAKGNTASADISMNGAMRPPTNAILDYSGGYVHGQTHGAMMAKAAGNATTLMGELGPEMVVTNGRYYIVGQNGPEMVDLAKDAIVFNHIQTQSLLNNGHTGEYGRPVTNETNAVSWATGNVHGGLAMASASSALAQLKKLKAMWESLAGATISSLTGAASGGGGGSSSTNAMKSYLKELTKYYNLLQRIDSCEKSITHQSTLRSKLSSDINKNGKAYYKSLKSSLKDTNAQILAEEEKNLLQQKEYKEKQNWYNEDKLFSQFYHFADNGEIIYNTDNKKKVKTKDKNGNTTTKELNGIEVLSELQRTSQAGSPTYTAKEQMEMLRDYVGEDVFKEWATYDTSGNEITIDESDENADWDTYYSNQVQAVMDKLENAQTDMTDLYSDIAESENKVVELQQDRNEILQEIRDNQMSVESSVLAAMEESRQREIDDLTDQRNALEESQGDYFEGLSNALSKEQEKYEEAQTAEDTNKLRRQLAILQRSGGSAAEIYDLQSQIEEADKTAYFDAQQDMIDDLQEAAETEIEKLDKQIDIMTQTLEFEKEHGLLWEQVYDVMAKSPSEIASYIMNNSEQYWANSPLKSAEDFQSTLFAAEQWTEFRDDVKDNTPVNPDNVNSMKESIGEAVYGTSDFEWKTFNTAMTDIYGKDWADKVTASGEQGVEVARAGFEDIMSRFGDFSTIGQGEGGNTLASALDTITRTLSQRATGTTPESDNGSTSGQGAAGTSVEGSKPKKHNIKAVYYLYNDKKGTFSCQKKKGGKGSKIELVKGFEEAVYKYKKMTKAAKSHLKDIFGDKADKNYAIHSYWSQKPTQKGLQGTEYTADNPLDVGEETKTNVIIYVIVRKKSQKKSKKALNKLRNAAGSGGGSSGGLGGVQDKGLGGNRSSGDSGGNDEDSDTGGTETDRPTIEPPEDKGGTETPSDEESADTVEATVAELEESARRAEEERQRLLAEEKRQATKYKNISALDYINSIYGADSGYSISQQYEALESAMSTLQTLLGIDTSTWLAEAGIEALGADATEEEKQAYYEKVVEAFNSKISELSDDQKNTLSSSLVTIAEINDSILTDIPATTLTAISEYQNSTTGLLSELLNGLSEGTATGDATITTAIVDSANLSTTSILGSLSIMETTLGAKLEAIITHTDMLGTDVARILRDELLTKLTDAYNSLGLPTSITGISSILEKQLTAVEKINGDLNSGITKIVDAIPEIKFDEGGGTATSSKDKTWREASKRQTISI